MAARVLHLELPTYMSVLLMGFIGASLLHRSVLRVFASSSSNWLDLQSVWMFFARIWLSTYILGAGCIWNDILDRDFDRQVGKNRWQCASCLWSSLQFPERTKNRPIASGAISVPGALVFLFVHLAIMFRMIWSSNPVAYVVFLVSWSLLLSWMFPSFQFGVISIVVLPGIYPFMKRITYWPQAWLGLSISVIFCSRSQAYVRLWRSCYERWSSYGLARCWSSTCALRPCFIWRMLGLDNVVW